MITLKDKDKKVLVILRGNEFPLYLEQVEVKDLDKKETVDYIIYRGKKGTVNIGKK